MKMLKQSRAFVLILACACLAWPGLAHATDVSFKSETLLRMMERNTDKGTDKKVLPAYEYLQGDLGGIGNEKLSFHFQGWGRLDLANSDYYEDNQDGEILYGYLEYADETANFKARLGRQNVFAGVANEVVDGLSLSSDLGKYLSASAYVGQPAALDEKNGRVGDVIYGGRIANHLASLYDVGVSYKQIRNDSKSAEEMLGVDIGLYLPYGVSLYGYSTRNLVTEGWGEHSYELRFNLGDFAFRPYYQMFHYEDQFGTGANAANPFSLLATSGEKLAVGGGDVIYRGFESWDLGAKVKSYTYELRDSSEFYSLLATRHDDEGNQIGVEAGIMVGATPDNKYTLLRGFFYRTGLPAFLPLDFVSGDVVWAKYDQDIYNKDSSLFVSLGIGENYLDKALAVKLSGDYSDDPYFDKDVRGMLTVTYAYDSAN